MGMDQGTLGFLQQGVDLAGDVMSLVNQPDDGSSEVAAIADEKGLLMEADAKADAREAQRQAKKEAARLRGDREALRGKANADWGGANLAMSGSRKLVKDANSIKDLQDEQDVLFEGQADADAILRTGRNNANMLRINGGATPRRSTLSLGSSIYSRS